jgi:hypothetical protein
VYAFFSLKIPANSLAAAKTGSASPGVYIYLFSPSTRCDGMDYVQLEIQFGAIPLAHLS